MTDLTHDLPFWEGFSISSLDVQDDIVRIRLEPQPDAAMVCSGCGHNCAYVHETAWRQIRDMPMLGRAVWLKIRLRRVRCSECGPRAERLSKPS